MRRLYSTFAGGWPGIGLLVMRLVVGSVLLVGTGPTLWSDPPLHLTLTSASLAVSGLLLVAGLWTPVAGAVVAVIEISQILRVAEHPVVGLLAATMAAASGDVRTRSLVGRRPALRMEAHRRTRAHE